MRPDFVTAPSTCTQMVLGTVQLGMPYGLANTTGRPDQATATEMVSQAWAAGVRCFDTAQAYGESEKVLGRALAEGGLANAADVVSKTHPKMDFSDLACFQAGLTETLANLGQERLWGFMLHREEDLDGWAGPVGRAMRQARQEGRVERLGVSVYSTSRALQALEIEEIEIIQVAANLFDRRMSRSDFFRQARERGKQVFVRSVYLQGLVLSPQSAIARNIPHAGEAAAELQGFCASHGVMASDLALAHVRYQAPGGRFILGAETVPQVRENCGRFARPPVAAELCAAWDARWPEDYENLVDPRFWPSSAK